MVVIVIKTTMTTTGQKHEAIAAQYYKEMAKANATIYHYDISTDKTDIAYIKSWLKKRNCKTFTEYLDAEEMF